MSNDISHRSFWGNLPIQCVVNLPDKKNNIHPVVIELFDRNIKRNYYISDDGNGNYKKNGKT